MPDPEMRKGRLGKGGPKSQVIIPSSLSNTENSRSALDLQAHRLRRLFFFAPDTACTIAALAYGVAR
jgi:hypothetical protein